jgi:hypothetical protein
MVILLDGKEIGRDSNNGPQYSLHIAKGYQARVYERQARCEVRRVPSGELIVPAKSLTIAAIPGPTCVPSLYHPLLNHSYFRDDAIPWSGSGQSAINAAAGDWNSLVRQFSSSTTAFRSAGTGTWSGQASVRIVIDPSLEGTIRNAETAPDNFPPGFIIGVNPRTIQYGYVFTKAVLTHELGHARGYWEVPASCPIHDSIMYPVFELGSDHWLGPGDAVATERDVTGRQF